MQRAELEGKAERTRKAAEAARARFDTLQHEAGQARAAAARAQAEAEQEQARVQRQRNDLSQFNIFAISIFLMISHMIV